MTQTTDSERSCQSAVAKLDAYMDRQLNTESYVELLTHLRICAACKREIQFRVSVRMRLRCVVREAVVPVGLEAGLRNRLRQVRRPEGKTFRIMAAAAAVALGFGSWISHELGTVRLRTAAPGPAMAVIYDAATRYGRKE
jgi:hypothetical protein